MDTTIPNAGMNENKKDGLDPAGGGTFQGAGSYAGRKADDAVTYAGQKAEDAASYASKKAEEAGSAAGSGLRSMGASVRAHSPESGMAGDAATAVADSLDSTGRYLEEQGISEMAEDLTNLIRRNPIPAIIIGIGAGYLIGKATTSRS